MNFYLLDDWKQIREDAVKNPNARVRYQWSPEYPQDEIRRDCDYCPACGAPISLLRWERPRKIYFRGSKFADRLSENLIGELVVSKRFKELYEKEGITGIERFERIEEVRIPGRLQMDSPIYYVAQVPYSQEVVVDPEASVVTGKISRPICKVCNPFGITGGHLVRIVLDIKSWQGTDVLNNYFVGLVFSQRFYEFIQDNNITNFPLTEIGSYHWV